MEFTERLTALADKVAQQKASLETEEATKNAFVMPFISTILGHDVFDPLEVAPEFTADVGVKKGEKIDYAIVHEQSEAAVEKDLRESSDGVVTTIEELEAFQIIRAIVCAQVKPQRVVYRDAKSYCAVLLDDNNRKSMARLHFNTGKKYIGLFDEEKKETRHPIDAPEDNFQYSDELRAAVERLTGTLAA